jgi:shikimate dehydrogenase
MKKLVYIFGDPVEHSKSPAMHNAAYAKLGISDKYEYLKKHIRPSELKEAAHMLRAENIAGANITVPHKEFVLQYLDHIDPLAQEIGAVNTVVNKNGMLYGYNTDAPGYIRALQEYNRFSVKNKKVAIFGAGGAAKAIAYMLCQDEATEIAVGEVDLSKAEKLAGNNKKISIFDSRSKEFLAKVAEADLVINCTPLGMHPNKNKTPLADLSVIRPKQLYSDIVYTPKETIFLKNALAKGASVNYGSGMLLWQGIIAFHHFTGVPIEKIPIKIMEQQIII